MNADLGWITLFNIIVNSVLSFYTSVILVLGFLLILRIKSPRVKALCCTLPFFKICIDLFFYQFSHWALAFDIDPMCEPPGTRWLNCGLGYFFNIGFNLNNGLTFSPADLIACSVNPFWIRFMGMLGLGVMLLSCGIFCYRLIRHLRDMQHMIRDSKPLSKPVLNSPLKIQLSQRHIHCVETEKIQSPCIFGKHILFPRGLCSTISQREFEAIVAHELSHYRWKDSLVHILCVVISSVFWWLPVRWWMKRLSFFQEMAADQTIHAFGISKIDLAQAILKTVKKETLSLIPLTSFQGRSPFLMKRVQNLLKYSPHAHSLMKIGVQFMCLAFGLSAILFGRLWIF